MKSGVFITGTDTNVGKTLISSLLLTALNQRGTSARYFKPVQTGLDDDSDTVFSLTGYDFLKPVFKFKEPVSPHWAAQSSHSSISISQIKEEWTKKDDFTIVEGAGGILVPLNNDECMIDLIQALDLPLLIVASTKLGTINHTLLTLEAARNKKLKVLGVITSGPDEPRLRDTLEHYGKIKVLTHIPQFDVSPQSIESLAPEFFSQRVLDLIRGQEHR